MIKNKYLISASFVIILILMSFAITFFQINDGNDSNLKDDPFKIDTSLIDPNTNFTRLDELHSYLEYGGIPKDGIKSINIPNWISVDEVDFMVDTDIVFGVDYLGTILAIPRKVLVQHEIMNLEIDNIPISIAYCPLTGSISGFKSTIDGKGTTFGVSGSLINSNLVMYDRLSDSSWPQILGQSVGQDGLKGFKLDRIQVYWTTWDKWVSQYPETLVQSINTGYIRGLNYEYDPYGSYTDNNSYYNSGGPSFWVENWDQRLEDKDVIIGIENNYSYLAIEKNFLRDNKVINTQVGNLSLVVLYDEDLDVAKVFESEFNNETLKFSYQNGIFIDDINNKEWNINGISDIGTLKPYIYMDSMWFGWNSFFPDTDLISSN